MKDSIIDKWWRLKAWWWVKIRKQVKLVERDSSEKPGYKVIKRGAKNDRYTKE